jgi:hypothetical protein
MAAGPTYFPIATVTASGVTSFLVMSSIPSTYTDLVLVGQSVQTNVGSCRLILNNDTSSGLYSQTVLYGNGTSSLSGRDSGNYFFLMDYVQSSTTTPNMAIVNIMNYANTSIYKTVLETSGATDKGTIANIGLWRNTSAVNRIDIASASNFSAGTNFTLYGIAAA